jgi:hypothetical protein
MLAVLDQSIKEKTTMNFSMMKGLALCGLCTLFASVGSAASAQADFHHSRVPVHHARPAIMRQKAAYARAVAKGHYKAAQRAHLKAMAIRHHVRARHVVIRKGHGF